MELKTTSSTGGDDSTQFERQGVFRFLDLPAKLRSEIYWLLLNIRNKIRVTRHIQKTDNKLPTWTDRFADRKRRTYVIGAETVAYSNGRQRKLAVASACSLSILRTSKTVHAEATPIFYGANELISQSTHALCDFKKRTKGFRLLKSIEVKSVNEANNNALHDTLFGLKNPSKVVLEIVTDPQQNGHNRVFAVVKWLWIAISGYVRDSTLVTRLDWLNSGVPGEDPKDYETSCKRRLDALTFIAPGGLVSRRKNNSTHEYKGQEKINTMLKKAILDNYLPRSLASYADDHETISKKYKAQEAAKQPESDK